jgi:hypothetical protein
MAIDDAAGRKAVRERRTRGPATNSVFVQVPRHSTRVPTVNQALREDVHQRGLAAAKKALRTHLSARTARP